MTVADACAWIGLDTVELGAARAWPSTRRRAEFWHLLTPSARLVFWAWTDRQPQGWWSLLDHVKAHTAVTHLTFRAAIQPLLDIGWAQLAPARWSHEIWLTREGRPARADLLRALRQ